jgi:hypothetical protein
VAAQLLAPGLPVTQVAQFMGHKDPSVTLDLYANHVVDDVQRLMGETAASLFDRHKGRSTAVTRSRSSRAPHPRPRAGWSSGSEGLNGAMSR